MSYCEHSGVKLEESNESRLAEIEGRVETFHEHRQYITQKKLTAALKRAVEALEFYANKNTYYAESNPYGYTYGLVPNHDCDASKEHSGLRFGGKRGREALADIAAIMGDET